MAKNEADREDLIREATALVNRVELTCAGTDEPITAGFRRQNGLSLFFGQDPVYQFDPEGRLRRAFVDGKVYRSQHMTLAEMTRVRTETQTILSRTDLQPDDLAAFRAKMNDRLSDLRNRIQDEQIRVSRVVDSRGDILARIAESLDEILQHAEDWLSSQIRRRA